MKMVLWGRNTKSDVGWRDWQGSVTSQGQLPVNIRRGRCNQVMIYVEISVEDEGKLGQQMISSICLQQLTELKCEETGECFSERLFLTKHQRLPLNRF